MRTTDWPAIIGRERVRFRDERDGTGRLVVADRADGHRGAALIIPDDGRRGAVHFLGPYDVEQLIAALQENAGADAIDNCS